MQLPLGLGWMLSNVQSQLGFHQQSFVTSLNEFIAAPSTNLSYTLPPLGYNYDALEPFFDEETMEIHHSKHHQTYVNNLNTALQDHELSSLDVGELVTKLHLVPADKRTFVRNNAGGHVNHGFFWKNLKLGTTLTGGLEEAIKKDFGSIDDFQQQFEKAATTVFGSGWAWLVKQDVGLKIVTTANQDSPLMGEDIAGTYGFPIIGLDVWEHAYYLKYRNRRPDYIKSFWNVVDWSEAQVRFDMAP